MKKYVLRPGVKGTAALHMDEMSTRPLGPRDVCVRVRCASLNYRDLINANMGVKKELIPLSDGAGTVEEAGHEVRGLRKGDRVVGLFFPRWQGGGIDATKASAARGGVPTDGMLADYVYGPEESFLKFPDYLTFEEASTLPCAGLTAWNALILRGELKPGETVVIQGTGGVALYALQIAKGIGARVILLSSKEDKIEKARKMGADELINYKKDPGWEDEVLKRTAGAGADLVLELGGGGTLDKSMKCVKVNGRISLVGVLTGFGGLVNPLPILTKSISVHGIYVGSCEMQKAFHRALEIGQIHPVVDRVFGFEDARKAYEYMQSAQHFGKIVVKMTG